MRRFGSWTTTHRKTVILGWVVALIAVGFAAGSAGSAFSENFKLPSSDSQRAVDLLEHRFPAQSGETATIVYRAQGGVDSPAVRRKMSATFAEIEKTPHVSEVVSPYSGPGAAATSEDGRIAYATVQFDEHGDEIGKQNVERSSTSPRARRAPASRSSWAGSRSRKSARKKATPPSRSA